MRDKLDSVDHKILTLLSNDAQMPYTEVAKRAGISPGTVHMRTRKMKNMGVIKGATLSLDYSKMGYKMTVFLGIYLRESFLYKIVIEELAKIQEVVKIHHSTGKYDIFIKVHAKDSLHYRRLYQEAILTIEGIRGIESFISVEENMSRHINFES
ncbi:MULTISPECIES: Lrp/AsnC family transcriptional regulator [Zobellia]|uniref:Lrp/AsnC family transcriptional regulator n=1 Tax=Zobellia TaxID=112040 RepID=UPI001BFFBBC2|nr:MULTISPECIES: Lrp/AsnC ligand binding domain-containing protein [Zobellia]MBT9190046.1 Lrp/AsnC ligand binding domain-containing protein [Zobellia russellii]MBU2973885.1 Lrp/AsnC ligand binding domain-containing protein [Zobellia sp. B3R18]MDO6821117.1 Lrp/AsnC ligand binding domain-containing protein [Zobellia sp. 1_MG-2023]